MNPVTYILISLFSTSLMLAAIFLVAWISFGRKRYTLAWAVAFSFSSVQWLLNLYSNDLFSDRNWYWITASAFQVTVLSINLWAHRVRVELKTNLWLLIMVSFFVEALIVWFTLYQPHVGLRTAIGVMYSAVILAIIAYAIISYRKIPLAAEVGAALVTTLLAIFQFAAGIAALLQGENGNVEYLQMYLSINFNFLPSAFIGMGLFVVFILASDLSYEMRTLALTDQLTGTLNRRGFIDAATRAFSRAKRYRDKLSVIVCDIDHFKKVNDTFGHAAGDKTLVMFVEYLKNTVREEDVVARTGGEEFVILLPKADKALAVYVAERIRKKVEEDTITTEKGIIDITASFGVAECDVDLQTISEVIELADQALFEAKDKGRNRVIIYGQTAV